MSHCKTLHSASDELKSAERVFFTCISSYSMFVIMLNTNRTVTLEAQCAASLHRSYTGILVGMPTLTVPSTEIFEITFVDFASNRIIRQNLCGKSTDFPKIDFV